MKLSTALLTSQVALSFLTILCAVNNVPLAITAAFSVASIGLFVSAMYELVHYN